MSTITLTPAQAEVVKRMNEYLDSSTDYTPFTLTGIGGAGKTTVVREVVKFRSGVIGATISHSAKFVLEQSLGGYAQCFTVAQLLGLKQVIGEDGEISFLPNFNRNPEKKLPIEKARIVIIDECSMIDKGTYKFLMSLKDTQCKIIFMGDPFQLPPVEDSSDSITFNHTKAELLQAMRYSGPIADLGNRIREEINKINEEDEGTRFLLNFWQTDELGHDCRTSCVNEDGSGYIFLNNIDDVVRIAISAFRDNEDSEAMRLIAYRNSSIQKINSVIRAQLYCGGDDSKVDDIPQFMPGELVICDGGYSVITPNAPFPVPIIHNNQTFKVVGTLPVNGPDEIRSLSMNLSPKPPVPENNDIVCLDWENGRYQYFEKHNELKNRAKEDGKLWPAYYRFKQQWAWFEYAYAINSHRGQGRTFTDVIVFENDIFNIKKNKLKAKLQALYVACTRAKRRVYIYNNKYRVDQSKLPDFVKEELMLK